MVNYKAVLTAIFLLLLSLDGLDAHAQQLKKHFVYFKDKANSAYSIDKPTEFLSERAIQRRTRYNIPVIERDLPVNRHYVQGLETAGAKVIYPSKWFNGALVECSDSTFSKIKELPFVAYAERLAMRDAAPGQVGRLLASTQAVGGVDSFSYGSAELQLKMLGADVMHQSGYRGEGMVIAVLDAGFYKVNELAPFKHLYEQGKVLGTYDFVDKEDAVYEDNTHGLGVLSCIAAYQPGQIVGTAFNANFYLFRTEDASQEYRVEELFWVVAAERADSLGVDVINSSLGYSNFDDPNLDYLLGDLNGRTAMISRASTMAAATGMLVVNSAGNSGDKKDWNRMITFPADADSILSVGAVDPMGKHARFSSRGPTIDGRIKPDVVSMGALTAVVQADGQVKRGFGTSYAAPLVCGFVAGLWQAHPELNNMQLIELIRQSSSLAGNPNDSLGYGIPNFEAAHQLANSWKQVDTSNSLSMELFPQQVKKERLTLQLRNFEAGPLTIRVTDINGEVVAEELIDPVKEENQLNLKTKRLKRGVYYVHVSSGNQRFQPLKFEKI